MCFKAIRIGIRVFSFLAAFVIPANMALGDITTSNITFAEAVQAVKDKNYQHAVTLFELQANAAQHDAQYNLALLLQSGKGRPRNYQQALYWAWSAYLGGIEPAEKLSKDIISLLPDDALKLTRERIEETLLSRIDTGDKSALMELALFYKELVEEPNFEEAYLWYSIASAFLIEGAVTAGNASGINDGTASIVLANETMTSSTGKEPMARIVSYGFGGVSPHIMGMGPVPASKMALEKAGLKISDLDVIESNEAFAAQACAVSKALGLPADIVNPNGGAIALGHPVGATGTILLTKLVHELLRINGKYGMATMCIGGGQGISVILDAAI